jgi:hypothetical protein
MKNSILQVESEVEISGDSMVAITY